MKKKKKSRENDDKIPVECLELDASSRHIATEFWPFQPTLHQPALTESKKKKKKGWQYWQCEKKIYFSLLLLTNQFGKP